MDDQNKDSSAPLQSDQKGDEGDKNVDKDPSDNLTPDHPRFKEVYDKMKGFEEQNQSLREELDEVKTQIAERQEETGDDELTDEEVTSLDRIKKALRKDGFITKEEFDSDKKVSQRAQTFERLSEKYNGKNGLPTFDSIEVATYAKKHGFGENYEAAYKEIHFDAIVQQRAKTGGIVEVPDSESPASGERGKPLGEVAPEDIDKMSPQEYEQHREKILQSLKNPSA